LRCDDSGYVVYPGGGKSFELLEWLAVRAGCVHLRGG
jgi:hypothetical protein